MSRDTENIEKLMKLALKAARRKSREEEISLHGKPLRIGHVETNPKTYNRKTKHKNKNFED